MKARLFIGVGCRRGASVEAIDRAVRTALGDALAFDDIACIASIDAKRNETGLNIFSERYGLPLHFFSADDISRVNCKPSLKAREHMNVDGVCEPCALLAGGEGAALIVAIARTSSKNQA
ncbi:Cobalamin biosynthesis protein CbiG [Candidatus Burkholderia verschuerenii]|uniref:Cobalamin biosynthesis protein CbiG n=1 Tax=Candidatus Burkholderia verschuerenii TaxID=242163 RepID=A0A0L0MBA7_9BURK|nr:cobalamin biosynthesis protein [Candidatus Burkholderia verschuerenii]KND59613.1 Cobalamin biosynthesis protein CbiG [Candidatus Burkholderia verschuerenii]